MLSGSARSAAQQQHGVSWGGVGWGGGPSHYVVTPTRVELSWAVTISWLILDYIFHMMTHSDVSDLTFNRFFLVK